MAQSGTFAVLWACEAELLALVVGVALGGLVCPEIGLLELCDFAEVLFVAIIAPRGVQEGCAPSGREGLLDCKVVAVVNFADDSLELEVVDVIAGPWAVCFDLKLFPEMHLLVSFLLLFLIDEWQIKKRIIGGFNALKLWLYLGKIYCRLGGKSCHRRRRTFLRSEKSGEIGYLIGLRMKKKCG